MIKQILFLVVLLAFFTSCSLPKTQETPKWMHSFIITSEDLVRLGFKDSFIYSKNTHNLKYILTYNYENTNPTAENGFLVGLRLKGSNESELEVNTQFTEFSSESRAIEYFEMFGLSLFKSSLGNYKAGLKWYKILGSCEVYYQHKKQFYGFKFPSNQESCKEYVVLTEKVNKITSEFDWSQLLAKD